MEADSVRALQGMKGPLRDGDKLAILALTDILEDEGWPSWKIALVAAHDGPLEVSFMYRWMIIHRQVRPRRWRMWLKN